MTDREQGFTLIETLIAFLILSLGLMISTQTVALATKSLARAKEDRSILATLARIDEDLTFRNSGSFPRRGAEGDIRWDIRKEAVAEDEGAGFIVIRITSPTNRKFSFVRFLVSER
ncbi:hypothetical protein GCM10010924_61850 [Rhizobium wenxiniae]|uniref:Prepilin-type N-terminal cleavage/methylation domain-containing protein n=2 Tax=Rhizobium TaxID=379 RepID=A0A7X0D393_9HYPH|nr:prepilin-type N-terminal cleavage/methylation domain-containing protein [Rhizobium wenxiniae]MBB6166374.1 prepilin-type N-terminal cleavage/methylation domain-containing protein [Rhizobium wenxiniae]GGG23915.1 hypothetical protein GCM10010924_61850 [Rhizobium wenxiniae]